MMKIVNIGSANIDYVYQMEHFIQPGETQSCERLSIGCGGKGLNQSIALAQAGTEVYHAGFIGAEGAFLAEKMKSKGVDTRFVRTGKGPNGHANIQVDASGQNCIILYGGTNRQFTHAFVDEVLDFFAAGDICVLQNEINDVPYIIERCHERGIRVAFNAAPYRDAIREYPLDKVDWLIVNEVEGGGLSGETDYDAIAGRLIELYPDVRVVLTMGRAGCIYRSAHESARVGACSVKAVDTTAAGDTFIGYFLRGVVESLPVRDALRLATVASAISVTRAGAADSVPSYDEVVHSALMQTV